MRVLGVIASGMLCLFILTGHAVGGVYPTEFSGASYGTPSEVEWDFGDGGSNITTMQPIMNQAVGFLTSPDVGMEPKEAQQSVKAYVQNLALSGEYCMDANFVVSFPVVKPTPQTVSKTLVTLRRQGLIGPCAQDVGEFLTEEIFFGDPNEATAFAEQIAALNLTAGDFDTTITICSAYVDSMNGFSMIDGLSPDEVAQKSLMMTCKYMQGGFPAAVMYYLHDSIIGTGLEACQVCSPQCCPEPCGFSGPFDYNSDGVVDDQDLNDLTTAWKVEENKSHLESTGSQL